MAVAKSMITASFLAGADLSSCQYEAIKMHTVAAGSCNEVTVAGSAAEKCIGILQNKPADGEEAIVAIAGVCTAAIGEASLSAGDYLSAMATGLLEQADAAHDHVIGMLLKDSSSAAGTTAEYLPILIMHLEATASDA